MDVTPLVKEGQQIIQGYKNGSFRVSGTLYDGAVIVTPSQTVSWTVKQFESLDEAAFQPLLQCAEEIDVVLLGTGKTQRFLPAPLRSVLKAQGLNVECMETGAACRTYNVLMAEGRRVAAALLPF